MNANVFVDVAIASAIAAVAAPGGAAFVLSEFDDSPGGQLIGVLFVVGAMAIGVWTTRRRRRPR